MTGPLPTAKEDSQGTGAGWKLWRQHNSAVRRSGLGTGQRLRCYGHLARRFARKWPALLGELKKSVLQLAGKR